MFAACADPKSIEGLTWAICYLTSGKHLDFYGSFITVMLLLLITAPAALALGFGGATAARSQILPARMLGKTYIAMVRGIPDIIFFLFFVIALDQAIEYLKFLAVCPAGAPSPWQGLEFRVCQEAKVPLGSSSAFWHNAYGFALAVVTFAIVFGAFTANVMFGAMQAVPKEQLETAEAYGMSHGQVFRRILVPQMWVYALPGLSNVWMLIIKATSLLSLLQIADIVLWADRLGAPNFLPAVGLVHADWRWRYYLVLFVFYILITWISEKGFDAIMRRAGRGILSEAR